MTENDTIYCCKLTDVSEVPELVTEFLSAFEYQFSSWANHAENIAYHTLYFDTESAADKAAARIETMIAEWRDYDIEISKIERLTIKREDWSEIWKKYFKVMQISEHLVIKPSWLEYDAKPDEIILEIDPGMSFGTGQHATTAFCLRMLDKLTHRQNAPETESFLDVGCGSGILSIAAAKLGFKPIEAFDYDADSVTIAAENYEINGLAKDAVALSEGDICDYETTTYDVVAANVLCHILRANKERIVSYVKPGGYLMLAGILNKEFAETAADFTACGLTLLESASEKEWTGGLFIKLQ